jgi:hypothetical protein
VLFFSLMVAIACAVILLRRRGFDVFALALASCVIYFLPGLFGFGFFVEADVPYVSLLLPGSYMCMSVVLSVLIAFAVVHDALGRFSAGRFEVWTFEADQFTAPTSLTVATVALAATLLTIGPEALTQQKKLFIDELGYTYWTFEIFASLGTLIAFAQHRFQLLFAGILLLMVDLMLGFRLGAITTILGALLLAGAEWSDRRLLTRWRLLLVLGLFFLAALVWKEMISGVKEGLSSGDFSILVNVLVSPNSYADAFFRSEPFVTTTILNEVVRNHYELPAAQLSGAFAIVLPFVASLDIEAATFGSLFQRDLFPEVKFGMAHNIWAQMHSIGGLLGVASYAIVFGLVIVVLQVLIRRTRGSLAAFLALSAAYWAFYSHRNDFFYQLILQRRIFFAFLAALLCSVVVEFLLSRASGARQQSSIVSRY